MNQDPTPGSDPGSAPGSGSGRDPSRPPVDASDTAAPPPPPPGYGPSYAQPPKQQGVLHRVAVSLIATVLLVSIGMNVYFGIIFASQFDRGVRETNYQAGNAAHRVTVVEVDGVIDDAMADYLRQAFLALEENPPKAIVYRINSPGGGVTASDQIWHYLDQFKAEHPDVPVVASFGAAAASGGYYIAMPCDYIIAETTCTTGSIGVMAQIPTVDGLMEKIGVEWVTMEATGSPRKTIGNNIYRQWTDEDRAAWRPMIDSAYERFLEVVVAGRADVLTEDQVREVANGSMYNAAQAEANGLIDQVGYLDEAIAKAAELAGVPGGEQPQVNIIRKPVPFGLPLMLGQGVPGGATVQVSPEQARTWLQEASRAQLNYYANTP